MRNTKLATSLLRMIPAFANLDSDSLKLIADKSEWKSIERGKRLIRRGDKADNLYLVLRGRFVVIIGHKPIAQISPGEPIGEIAFFAHGTRSANVYATRQSDVLVLSREAYRDLAREIPALSDNIIAALARRVAIANPSHHDMLPTRGTAIAVIGLNQGVAKHLISSLEQRFQSIDDWKILSSRTIPDLATKSRQDLGLKIAREEVQHKGLLLICDDPEQFPLWADTVIENCDHIYIVSEQLRSVKTFIPLAPIEEKIFDLTMHTPAHLVLVRADEAVPIQGTARWLRNRYVDLHHHCALSSDKDIQRLIRFMKGTALGAVLCGGGALGSAHIGMLKALMERGIEFDIVGGTSVGSAMSAAIALGLTPDFIIEKVNEIFVTGRAMHRLTVPVHSIIDHKFFDQMLEKHYGNDHIEDLALNFFAVATSLSRNDIEVIRSGPVWEAVRASSSIPAVLPPFIREDGEVLIDGALIDNAPISIMRQLKPGPNLVMNFKAEQNWRVYDDYKTMPGRLGTVSSLIPFVKKRTASFPKMPTVLARSMVVNSRRLLDKVQRKKDVFIDLEPIKDMSFLDWHRTNENFKLNYQQIRNCLNELEIESVTTEQQRDDALRRLGDYLDPRNDNSLRPTQIEHPASTLSKIQQKPASD